MPTNAELEKRIDELEATILELSEKGTSPSPINLAEEAWKCTFTGAMYALFQRNVPIDHDEHKTIKYLQRALRIADLSIKAVAEFEAATKRRLEEARNADENDPLKSLLAGEPKVPEGLQTLPNKYEQTPQMDNPSLNQLDKLSKNVEKETAQERANRIAKQKASQ